MKAFKFVLQKLFIVLFFSLLTSSVNAGTAIKFNGEDAYIDMEPWTPTGSYRVVAWLGDLSSNSGDRVYLTSSSHNNEFLSYYPASVQHHISGSYPGIWNKFNFAKTRYIEITIDDGQMKVSDGEKESIVYNDNITTKVTYDQIFKRANTFSKGALQSIAFIDLENIANSRTIAFSDSGQVNVISSDDSYAHLVNVNVDDYIYNLDIPHPKVSLVDSAEELGELINKTYPNKPMLMYESFLESRDIGRDFAWEGHYWVRTYINLYKATNDIKYINLAVELVDFMLENTDDRRALTLGLDVNSYFTAPKYYINNRNEFAPGWTQTYLNNGLTVLTDGMIVNSVMRLVDIIKTDNIDTYNEVADNYIQRSKVIVDSHNSSWSETKQGVIAGSWYYVNRGNSYYGNSGLYSNPVAYNHSLTMATAMIYLDKWLGGVPEYQHKLKKLEIFFLDNVVFNNDGTCEWNYSWNSNSPVVVEDVNHGHLDVGYFVIADKEGYLEDDSIPKCMAKTVVEKIAIGPGVIPERVDGSGVSAAGDMFAVSYDYRELSKYEPSISARSDNILRQFVKLNWHRPFAALSESFAN